MPNFIIIQGYHKWIIPLIITLVSIIISIVFIEPFRKRIYNIENFVKEHQTNYGKKDVEEKDVGEKDVEEKDVEEKDVREKDVREKDVGEKEVGEKEEEVKEEEEEVKEKEEEVKKVNVEKGREEFTNGIYVKEKGGLQGGLQGYNYEDYNTQYKSYGVEMQEMKKRSKQCESSLNKKINEYEKMNVLYKYEPALLKKEKTSYYNGIGVEKESLFSNY